MKVLFKILLNFQTLDVKMISHVTKNIEKRLNKDKTKREIHCKKRICFSFDKEESVICKSCNFFNDIFVSKNIERSHMESKWRKTVRSPKVILG